MPQEIFDEDEFLEIARTRASVCRIKRTKDAVKLKLRTPKTLYTLKTTPEKGEVLLREIEIQQIEV
jgi:hypothetical protein